MQFKNLTILSIFAIAISSCGVSNKLSDNYTDKVDSTFTQIKKEDSKTKSDSTEVKKSDNSIETEWVDSSSIKIDFDSLSSDSAAYTDIVIKKDSVGNITINTGGKKIKSITNATKKSGAKIEANKKQDSIHVINSVSNSKVDSASLSYKKDIKSVKSKKFSIQLAWYVYVIIGLFIVLFWFFYPNIIAAKKVVNDIKLPYSAPNDKK